MGAIAAIGGALISGISANKAAGAQRDAARSDMAFQKETRDLQRSDFAPWRDSGERANAALDFELGLGARPTFGGSPAQIEAFTPGQGWSNVPMGQPGVTGFVGDVYDRPRSGKVSGSENFLSSIRGRPGSGLFGSSAGGGTFGSSAGQRFRVGGQEFATRAEAEAYASANPTGGIQYGGYTKTPGYDFRMGQGLDAIESSAAARGGLYSGAALQDSLKFGQDYASNEYSNYLARLTGQAGAGQAAAGGQAVAAGNAATGVSNALAASGNASAAGAIGVGNALSGGLQNLYGNWQYQKQMGGGGGGVNVGGNLFGGNSWG